MVLGTNYRRSARPDEKPVEGIFCDCYGTLFAHGWEDDKTLVTYLNAKYADGINVVIFSTAPKDVRANVQALGLHPDLSSRIDDKRDYEGQLLEVMIDDDPAHYLRAQKIWHPKSPEFRQHMKNFLTSLRPSEPENPPKPL
jgi:hypothetical protein